MKPSLSCVAITVMSMVSDVTLQTPKYEDVLLSHGKPVHMTSTLNYNDFLWYAEKAVDGNITNDDPDSRGCCAATKDDPNEMFTLNLKESYKISRIKIYGRAGGVVHGDLRGFAVYLSTSASIQDGVQVHTIVTTALDDFTVNRQEEYQFVIVRSTGSEFIVICEIQVYTQVCQDGYYDDCTKQCGQCQDDAVCNKTSGNCPNGCKPGFQGERCSTPCDWGKYGDKCLSTCGNCLHNTTCNIFTGICDQGCNAGYTGTDCKTACIEGTYGPGCQSACGNCKGSDVCDRFNGRCKEGCEAGYEGSICKTECPHSTFGKNCINNCHCADNATCDRRNGTCSNGRCNAGYAGHSCSVVCIHPQYGQGCSYTCNCYSNSTCNHVTGRCDNGQCASGWTGSSCNEGCPLGTFGHNCVYDCGLCKDGDACDTSTGVCPNGCRDGYEGELCLQTQTGQNSDVQSSSSNSSSVSIPVIVGTTVAVLVVCILSALLVFHVYKLTQSRMNGKGNENQNTVQEVTMSQQHEQQYESLDLSSIGRKDHTVNLA